MNTKQFLSETANLMGTHPRPHIFCKDGFTVSIQASEFHYCSPRETLKDGNYNKVELGFPSEKEDLIINYAEEPDCPTKTVYGWVPTEIVDKVLAKHGGIDFYGWKAPEPEVSNTKGKREIYLKDLIAKLQEIADSHGNPEVVFYYDTTEELKLDDVYYTPENEEEFVSDYVVFDFTKED